VSLHEAYIGLTIFADASADVVIRCERLTMMRMNNDDDVDDDNYDGEF